MASLPTVQPGRVILNGENPFIWLYDKEGGERTTEASIWTITYSEKGAGHALFIKSELTDNQWRIYTDNFAMARWMQTTVQGMLNPGTADLTIPILEAVFTRNGAVADTWTQIVKGTEDEIIMTWENIQVPMLVQDEKVSEPGRPYGVSAIMLPAGQANLTINGQQASGNVFPMDLNGHAFSTGALAFSESWRAEE